MDTIQDVSISKKCIVCGAGSMLRKKETFFLDIFDLFSSEVLVCEKCKAKFRKLGSSYKFIKTNNTESDIWKEYGRQTLTAREWINIENGGMSDENQKKADIEQWLRRLSIGTLKVNFEGVKTPIILKPGEDLLFALPNINLKEPRAVSKSRGSYAGPSFRVAKGISFRMGSFSSTTESHQEIRNIDQGVLTITNERFVFSGRMKTINIDLRKVVQVDPFTDGLALHKEGREKTQYFVWNKSIGSMQLSQGGRSYNEPINGMILKCVMEGAIKTKSKQ